MFRPVSRLSAAMLLGVLLAGCGWMPWVSSRKRAATEKALAESKRAALVVGRVALVNEGEHFALIEAEQAQPPPAGTTLRIYAGDSLSAELRASSVHRRPFFVADLVSGLPAKGDLVVQPGAGETPPRAVAVAASPAPAPAPRPGWKRWLGFFGRRQ